MLTNFKEVGCLMNLKLQFLDSHIEYFPENLGDFSEEQGERMHQDLREFEKIYQGVWGKNMLADYCWSLQRESNTLISFFKFPQTLVHPLTLLFAEIS